MFEFLSFSSCRSAPSFPRSGTVHYPVVPPVTRLSVAFFSGQRHRLPLQFSQPVKVPQRRCHVATCHTNPISTISEETVLPVTYFCPDGAAALSGSLLIKPQTLRFPLAVKKNVRPAHSEIHPAHPVPTVCLVKQQYLPPVFHRHVGGKSSQPAAYHIPVHSETMSQPPVILIFQQNPYVPLIMTDVQSPVPHRMPHPESHHPHG